MRRAIAARRLGCLWPAVAAHAGPRLHTAATAKSDHTRCTQQKTCVLVGTRMCGSLQPLTSLTAAAASCVQRIASGEFTDAGSTKERLTRPIRRALAKDPVGPGACRCNAHACACRLAAAADPSRGSQPGIWWRWVPSLGAGCSPTSRPLISQPHPRPAAPLPAPDARPQHPPRPAGRALSMRLAKIGQRWQRNAAERMPTATGDIREIVGQPVFVPLFKLYQIYGKVFKLSFGPKQFVIVSDPQLAKHVSCGTLFLLPPYWRCR